MKKETLLRILARLGLIGRSEVYYIGGSDILPPPLKQTEEQGLLKELEAGDVEAKQRLIERNLRDRKSVV